jgi:RloB-like protein
MSVTHDPDWWRKRKAEAVERKKRIPARSSSGDTILIVTEGTVTEPSYLGELHAMMRLAAVKVVVMPSANSAPLAVVRTAAELASKQRLKARRKQLGISAPEKFDQVWAVIDTDVPLRQGTWGEVVNEAVRHGVLLAHSTPCFEFWLLLHLGFWTPYLASSSHACQRLGTALGYSYLKDAGSVKRVVFEILDSWPIAVRHANRVRNFHAQNGTPSPANPSTDVDQLVIALNSAAAPPYRIPL